ncbi:hypothetical protein HZA98_01720 [Candidatus Woesearchaeota archaeon]|nr:hypothetical protein [Candidatus Woesearchaeota archaeon]
MKKLIFLTMLVSMILLSSLSLASEQFDCKETGDVGNDPLTDGSVTLTNASVTNRIEYDSCSINITFGYSYRTEYSCDSKDVRIKNYYCDGCTNSSVCDTAIDTITNYASETDGGNYPLIPGSLAKTVLLTTNPSGKRYSTKEFIFDKCSSAEKLTEVAIEKTALIKGNYTCSSINASYSCITGTWGGFCGTACTSDADCEIGSCDTNANSVTKGSCQGDAIRVIEVPKTATACTIGGTECSSGAVCSEETLTCVAEQNTNTESATTSTPSKADTETSSSSSSESKEVFTTSTESFWTRFWNWLFGK